MHLTQHTDYAFRMLIHAALRAPRMTTVREVAVDFGLSAAHLNKVAQTLAAHGYLETVRGRAGGLRLIREPVSIRLGEVAKATEPDFHLVPCMAPDGNCPIYDPCLLRNLLFEAGEVFLTELNKWTLADLVKRPQPLLVAIATSRAGIPV